MVRLVPRHHLVTRYTVQHRVHHGPLPVGESPSALAFLNGEIDCSSPPYISLEPVVLDHDPAPDYLAWLGDALDSCAAKGKGHTRLARTDRTAIPSDQMFRGHRPRDFKCPHKFILTVY